MKLAIAIVACLFMGCIPVRIGHPPIRQSDPMDPRSPIAEMTKTIAVNPSCHAYTMCKDTGQILTCDVWSSLEKTCSYTVVEGKSVTCEGVVEFQGNKYEWQIIHEECR
jgi:hypothetical protein